jgi:uncharacterized tellurite resistance protein B-like protein
MNTDPQSQTPEPEQSAQSAAESSGQSSGQSLSKSSGSQSGKSEVTKLVDQLLAAKRISYTHYQELSQLVLADGDVDEQERRQINRLFDAIQIGAVRIID